jgi:hypothetical protein
MIVGEKFMAKRVCGGRQASWARIHVVGKSVVLEVEGEDEGEDEGERCLSSVNSLHVPRYLIFMPRYHLRQILRNETINE